MAESPFAQTRLENGLTVVVERMEQVRSVACGFLARTGARDDPPAEAGVSHFLEHMCFKGTPRRTWEQVNIEFDEIGGDYNAYTSKDRTMYYAWVRTCDLERQLDLLADMMRPTLPAEEFDVEKNVVLEEIAMAGDELTSHVYDFLFERMCADSPLAWPVLGYEKTIKGMTREQMQDYFDRRYAPENLILVVAGNVEPNAVFELAQRYCGSWTPRPVPVCREAPTFSLGTAHQVVDRFHQQAIVLAYPSVSASHPLNETSEALAAILGGPNSRFYWNIMQKGLSTRAGVIREEYGDFGMLIMYALCEPANCEIVLDAMQQQARDLTASGTEPKELQRVKNLRRTGLAVESEAPFYRLGQIVDDVDYRGRPRTTEERFADVEAISNDTIRAYLDACPITGDGCLVSVGPRDWPGGSA